MTLKRLLFINNAFVFVGEISIISFNQSMENFKGSFLVSLHDIPHRHNIYCFKTKINCFSCVYEFLPYSMSTRDIFILYSMKT